METRGWFVCACCGGSFEQVSDDEEVMAEARLLWGPLLDMGTVTVCDDCFKREIVEEV